METNINHTKETLRVWSGCWGCYAERLVGGWYDIEATSWETLQNFEDMKSDCAGDHIPGCLAEEWGFFDLEGFGPLTSFFSDGLMHDIAANLIEIANDLDIRVSDVTAFISASELDYEMKQEGVLLDLPYFFNERYENQFRGVWPSTTDFVNDFVEGIGLPELPEELRSLYTYDPEGYWRDLSCEGWTAVEVKSGPLYCQWTEFMILSPNY